MKAEDLEWECTGCDLKIFRGFTFRYEVLSDGTTTLTLDVSAHYIHRESALDKIKKEGFDWLREKIGAHRSSLGSRGKESKGVHFFYSLLKRDVVIVDYDMRPISKIPLDKAKEGVQQTVAEYLKAKYHVALDETQPALRSEEGFYFAPQYMHLVAGVDEVPNRIVRKYSHLSLEVDGSDSPAANRWREIQSYIKSFGFDRLAVGDMELRFNLMICTRSGKFERLKLKTVKGVTNAPLAYKDLAYGFLEPSLVTKVFINTGGQKELALSLYRELRTYAEKRYSVSLDDKPVILEYKLTAAKEQLRSSVEVSGARGCMCLVLLPEGSEEEVHNELTNACGELHITSKCVSLKKVREALNSGKKWYP
jgi:hypothetical protein